MQHFLRWLSWLSFALVALLAAIAMMENRAAIELQFLGYRTAAIAVFWWLLASFGIGLLVGWLAGATGSWRARRGARRAERALEDERRQVEQQATV